MCCSQKNRNDTVNKICKFNLQNMNNHVSVSYSRICWLFFHEEACITHMYCYLQMSLKIAVDR